MGDIRHSSDSIHLVSEQKLQESTLLLHNQPPQLLDVATHAHRPLFRFHTRLLTLILVTSLILITIVLATISLPFTPSCHNHSSPLKPGLDPSTGKPASWFGGSCGNSSTEALQCGCHFDMVSFAWHPPACFTADDADDEALFMGLRSWRFHHENGSEIAIEEVRRGELRVAFTDLEWHLTHCTFMWKKLHRALLAGGKVDSYVGDYTHTKHCEHMILQNVRHPEMRTETRVWVKYPTCG